MVKYLFTAIIEALMDVYTLEELAVWLDSPQRMLNNETPYDLIEAGRGDEVLRLARQMQDGTYL